MNAKTQHMAVPSHSATGSGAIRTPFRQRNWARARAGIVESQGIINFKESGVRKMKKTRGDPIDQHVGRRLRQARLMAGLSQTVVGQKLGISFQQIQKYETGTNRVGAGRLYRLAGLFGVPVSFFYEEMPQELRPAGPGHPSWSTGQKRLQPPQLDPENAPRAVLRLANAFLRIGDPELRSAVLSFVSVIARSPESAQQRDRA